MSHSADNKTILAIRFAFHSQTYTIRTI